MKLNYSSTFFDNTFYVAGMTEITCLSFEIQYLLSCDDNIFCVVDSDLCLFVVNKSNVNVFEYPM